MKFKRLLFNFCYLFINNDFLKKKKKKILKYSLYMNYYFKIILLL